MEEEKEECKISLGLAIGINNEEYYHKKHQESHVQLHALFPPQPEEEEQHQRPKTSRNRDEEYSEGDGTRKKLRLTQEQVVFLEDNFRENNVLGNFQKQELAEKLRLKPRQVEVWFQNRRARNKVKQTEVDFQMLKQWCETMNKENLRLKHQLQELKLYLKNSERITLCPSCSKKSSTSEVSSIHC